MVTEKYYLSNLSPDTSIGTLASGLIGTDDSVLGFRLRVKACGTPNGEQVSRSQLRPQARSALRRSSRAAFLLKSTFGGRGSFC